MGCDGTATGKLLVLYVKWDCRGRGDVPSLSLLVWTPSDARKPLLSSSLPAWWICTWGCRAVNRGLIRDALLLASLFLFQKHTLPASAGKRQGAALYLSTFIAWGRNPERVFLSFPW